MRRLLRSLILAVLLAASLAGIYRGYQDRRITIYDPNPPITLEDHINAVSTAERIDCHGES